MDKWFRAYGLGLTKDSASVYLSRLVSDLPRYNNQEIDVTFLKGGDLGFGSCSNHDGDVSKIKVNTGGAFDRLRLPWSRMDDLTFTTMVTTLYHEYGHYMQNHGPLEYRRVENAVSELSAVGNGDYYFNNWRQLPHEISAEATGVSMAWDYMERMFPGKADACMLNYLNHRMNVSTYMIDREDGLFQSKSDVMSALHAAWDRSVYEPRVSYGDIRRQDNESVLLLDPDRQHGYVFRSPYDEFWNKLIDTMPGSQKDRKMAALVLHVRPEEKLRRPVLAQEDLSIEHEFGKPFPESTEASRKRLGINVQTKPRPLESNRSFGRLQRLWENMQAEAESEDDGPDFDI